MKNKNSLWVEKYRPDSLEGYICSQEIKDKFATYIENNDIPHLLFAGSVGIGKTTAALLLINSLDCDKIIINASDERGIDTIRNKISTFAKTAGFKKLKVVLLEEADKLTTDAQDSLRYVTEQYSKSTRFIITCNYPELLSDALKSRFRSTSLVPPSIKDVALHMLSILDKEGVTYDKKDVGVLVKENYPDIRHMIKVLQDDSHTGTYKPSETNISSHLYINEIIDILSLKKSKEQDFEKIRQILANSGALSYLPLYKKLYSDIDKYSSKKKAGIMLVIADTLYKDYFVADKEINAMSCLIQIIGEVYG